MIRLRLLIAKLSAVLALHRSDADLDDDIEAHLDLASAHYRAAGMTDTDARLAALRDFGNLTRTKETYRDTRGFGWIGDMVSDVRYAARQLRRQPGFFAIAVVSLAVGIGANTAIFTVLDVLMLRPLTVRHPEELVAFRVDDGTIKQDYWYYVNHSYPDYVAIRNRTTVFLDVAAIALLDRFGVTIDDATDPAAVRVALVSGNYFRVFGAGAAVGRTLTVDDDRTPDAEPFAVISDAYWASRFDRASNIVGRTLRLNGTTYTILGVMPRSFTGDWIGRPTDIWIPIMMQSEVMAEMPGFLTRGNGWLRMVGRLKPGVSINRRRRRPRSCGTSFS